MVRDSNYNDGGEPRSPERIETEIRQTRNAMDETIDELGRHLEPRRLFDEAWGAIRENVLGGADVDARQASRAVGRTAASIKHRIAQHPIPAALIGVGIAWLLTEESTHSSVRTRDVAYTGGEASRRAASGIGSTASAAGSKIGGIGNKAGHAASDVGSSIAGGVGHAASSVAHGAGSAFSAVGHGVGSAASGIGHAAESAASAIGHGVSSGASGIVHGTERAYEVAREQYEERPLAFGAAALAAGLALGLLIPDTRAENRAFGRTGQRIRRRASAVGKRAGRDVYQAAKQTASEGVERVGEALEHHADEAGEEVRQKSERMTEGKPASQTDASRTS